MSERIPILDLQQQYRRLKDQIDTAVQAVFANGHFIMGPNVVALEEELAAYLGAGAAISLNSGTDALHLALRALDIGPGDEVVTSPFTFVATTEAIGIVGARPVFADIDPATYNVTAETIASAITPRTKAIMPVHLYGTPAPMAEIMALAQRHGIAVVEDCAQAIGAKIGDRCVGTFGEFGCFSFFPSKNLGAYGDGGLLTTNDPQLAERAKMLRVHGGRIKYHHECLGVNSRLDEVQAAILRVKLPYLEEWTDLRRAAAQRYGELLADCPGVRLPVEPSGTRCVYHQYTIRVNGRDAVQAGLAQRGVQTMIYYPVPLHLQAVHASLDYALGDFPNAEAAAAQVLSLPMFPELTAGEQAAVAGALESVLMIAA